MPYIPCWAKYSEMTRSAPHTLFYRQMIDLLQHALHLLDEQGQAEVLQFIASQQNADGGFKDRGGRSDLYYSLFGAMLMRAIESETRSPKSEESVQSQLAVSNNPATRNTQPVTESVVKLKRFVQENSSKNVPGFIEQCCLVLLQKELRIGRISRLRTFIQLSRSFWKERYSINLSYRSFVLFLTLDTVLPFPGLLKFGAERMLKQTAVDQYSPCSEVAAKVFLQKMLGENNAAEVELLKSFADKRGGFRAFHHVEQPDMLSTAVALFALDFAGSDLRLLKPSCLDFIQENYSDGAFLSGDGDPTMDVEYTFYGLLALGVLAR